MSEYCIGLCTCPTEQVARTIAETLVREKHAACVNIIGNIESLYMWDGVVQQEREHQLVIKMTVAGADKAFKRVRQLHPYDVPEWLIIDNVAGSNAYLTWIKSSIQ